MADQIIVTTVPQLEALIYKAIQKHYASATSIKTHNKEIISQEELCRRLGISVQNVIRMRKRRELPYLKCGTSIRFNQK